jgi:formylglycine-generating enzyme required for sulfatase activity
MRLAPWLTTACCAGALWTFSLVARQQSPKQYTNSLGIRMIRIEPGTFRMGNSLPTDPARLGQLELLRDGDYDEKPVHEVRITYPFYISETEITSRQFQEFRYDHQDAGRFPPYATGMSWHDAVAFCEWLSRKEKRNYRLPTEAEWEYVARAGTTSHFSSGEMPPPDETPNPWGVKNMHTGPLEWVLDWHGLYPEEPQVDPVGPESGVARVVRGGGIMGPYRGLQHGFLPYYRRSANRASVAPEYRGQHPIGFRIVEAPLPSTRPWPVEKDFIYQAVKQSGVPVKAGPDPEKPWFRRRILLPIPPENQPWEAIVAAGLHPSQLGHNHSASLEVCPNGDLFAVFFSSSTPATEYFPNTSFVATRLRFGAEQWDMPGPFYDFADVNDQSSLLWNDGGVLHHFGGGIGLWGVPFRWNSSRDSGASWDAIKFPLLVGPLGGYSTQPISHAFRGPDRTIYLSSDAIEGESLLWASRDEGRTWFDTGGRTAGRHTVFVRLRNGCILGIGGKNTDIDGYMPQTVSCDGGKTWSPPTKTPFPALGSNQRPSLVRLASGRLFFASDFQHRDGRQPKGVSERGVFVALSDDEGKTWKIKKLPGGLPHEAWTLKDRKGWSRPYHGDATLGYSVAVQAPNGVIHLTTSMNHPSLHFEMNEAWILSDAGELPPPAAGPGRPVRGEEKYPDGKIKARWSGKILADGRFVLDGPETWFFPNGAKLYEVQWADGYKRGVETLWREDGSKVWQWEHRPDGTSVWTQYWPNGRVKRVSEWKEGRCHGTVRYWGPDGALRGEYQFREGDLVR